MNLIVLHDECYSTSHHNLYLHTSPTYSTVLHTLITPGIGIGADARASAIADENA